MTKWDLVGNVGLWGFFVGTVLVRVGKYFCFGGTAGTGWRWQMRTLSVERSLEQGAGGRVKADAIVKIPEGMDFEQAMQVGTAGFTAMLCVMALEQYGIRPSDKEMVVTGAAGGIGRSAAVRLARAATGRWRGCR